MYNEFNEGGTHEQNPLGGIPLGQDGNGNMNLVEQGETQKGAFIYSDRFLLTLDVIESLNLPKSFSGKTPAEASKIINNKFKDRTDKISTSTKNNFLDKIAQAQESIKVQKQQEINNALAVNSTEVPDMMNGQIPQGMNQFAWGGVATNNLFNQDAPEESNKKGFDVNKAAGYGQMAGQIGSIIGSQGSFGKQAKSNEEVGFYDEKLAKDQQNEEMAGQVKDTVASALGPFGQLFRGIQKAGKGIGDSVGGETGAAISGAFSPEEATMANFGDKDLSFGEKLLGTVPGLGAVQAHRQAKKRQDKFMKEKLNAELFYKYGNTENTNRTQTFAFGGELGTFGEDPKKKISKEQLLNATVVPGGNANATSRYLDIVGMQRGVIHPKKGRGAYFYSGKSPLDPGYDPIANREFIQENAIQPYLNSEQGKKYQDLLNKQIALDTSSKLPVYSYSYLRPNSYANGGNLTGPQTESEFYQTERRGFPYWYENYNKAMNPLFNREFSLPESAYVGELNSQVPKEKRDKKSFLDKLNFSDFSRYSPIISNYKQLRNLSKPEVESLDRLNSQYQKQYLDETALENKAREQASNTINALNQAGISGGQLINAQIASQLANTKGVSDAYNQIRQFNINENKIEQDIRRQNEQSNIGQSNLEKDINARNRAAYQTQKSKLIGQIGTDLGEVGKEQTYKKMAKEMFGYEWDGKYYVNKEGVKKTEEEMKKDVDNRTNENNIKKALGGYLKQVKKSFKY
jgi:hypothetical protein